MSSMADRVASVRSTSPWAASSASSRSSSLAPSCMARASAPFTRVSGERRSWAKLSVTVLMPVSSSSIRSSMAFSDMPTRPNGSRRSATGERAERSPPAIRSAVLAMASTRCRIRKFMVRPAASPATATMPTAEANP